MTNKKITTTQIANFICAALSLLIIILQFTPFWNFDGGSLSISSYIWFPSDHTDLTAYLTAELRNDYSINSIVAMPILVLVGGAAGAALCVIKSKTPYTLLIPAFVGAVGAWGFLTKPAYQLGGNWVLQLIICIVLLVFAVAALVYGIKKEIDESKKTDRE